MRPLVSALAGLLLVVAAPVALRAQGLAGTYSAPGNAGPVVLTLAVTGGRLTGTLAGGGERWTITGEVDEDGDAEGTMLTPQGTLFVALEVDGDELMLLVAEMDADGEPNLASARELSFARGAVPAPRGDVARGAPTPQAAPAPAPQPAPAEGGLHDGTALGREWAAHLAGKKLTKMESYSSGTSGGYSSRADAYLCSSGDFLYRDQSSVSVDVGGASGSAGGQGGEQGRWRVITQGQVAGLELRMANGTVTQVRLDFQDGKTFADGERVFVTPAEICP